MNRTNILSFPGLGIDEFSLREVAISLFNGKVEIAWYSLFITSGIVFAFFYVMFRFKENKMNMEDLLDLAIFTVLPGIIGARIYYVLFELDSYIVTTEGSFFANFFASLGKMVAIWNGGIAIYGAVIGGGLGAVLVARHKKISIFKILDFLAPGVMMAQAIGRWGNFFNAEAYGSETTLPWRMGIGHPVIRDGVLQTAWTYHHPTFLYESLWNLVGFLVIYFVFVRIKKNQKFEGQIFYMYVTWYGIGRAMIEGLRTDSLWLIPDVIRVSQLVAVITAIAGAAMITYNFIKLRKAKQNGENN